jgi:hypothetical protein
VVDQRDAIGFAEKVLELLDEGRYTATYKYAVLLALKAGGGIDVDQPVALALEHPPQTDSTRRARSESDRVVRIAGRVRLAAFVAAPRPREFQQRFAAESERQAPADAVLHVVEVELTVGQAPC